MIKCFGLDMGLGRIDSARPEASRRRCRRRRRRRIPQILPQLCSWLLVVLLVPQCVSFQFAIKLQQASVNGATPYAASDPIRDSSPFPNTSLDRAPLMNATEASFRDHDRHNLIVDLGSSPPTLTTNSSALLAPDDIVISSAEILGHKQETLARNDAGDTSSTPGPQNSRHSVCQPEQQSTSAERPDCGKYQTENDASNSSNTNTNSNGNGNNDDDADTGAADNNNVDSTRSSTKIDTRYSSSHLLFRLFLFGLFSLVLLSLVIVYTIKYCICERRKRQILLLRQGDLVADSSLGCSHFQPIHLSMCQTSAQLPAIFGSNLGPFPTSTVPEGALSDCLCRLPLYTTSSLHHAPNSLGMAMQSRPPIYPYSANNTNCLLESAPNRLSLHEWRAEAQPMCPPAYSELFANSTRPPAPVTARNAQGPTVWSPTSPTASASSSCPTEPRRASDKSLLVKLDLNKTRLLSANDLLLLSKLIDVPIMIESDRSARVEQGRIANPTLHHSAQPTATTSANSEFNPSATSVDSISDED